MKEIDINNMEDLSDLEQINLPFDIHAVRPQCIRCVRRQLKKFKNDVDENKLSLDGRFVINCTGVLKNLVDPKFKKLFSPSEWEDLDTLKDPPKWVAKFLTRAEDGLPLIARPYQEEVMRCTSNRRALRISRRTGKTELVSAEICYWAMTKENIRILVCGPQKVHVEEIMGRVRGFLYRNPELRGEIIKDVSSPHFKMVFKNGSEIRGFAVGTSGKSEATAIRGQNADLIYMDEMDYADDEAIMGGVFPILQTNGTCRMTGFSTPTGFKSTYYKICEEAPEYVEFHYDYKVLPHWKEVEKDRPRYTEEKWQHEMLALWGESESGVYKPSYIDRSQRGYSYSEMRPAAGWRYGIGVDWNEKHGAEIIVVGENISGGFYQVMDGVNVEKSEFTQLKSVEELIATIKRWNPVFVYADAGNGSTNIELLRKLSYDQRRPGGDKKIAKIFDILKRYDSGASIETHDPVTNELIKAPAKPYMVNAAVRFFEQDQIRLSAGDKELDKQLRNYIIDRISPTGTPVYKMRDASVADHRLDALNLALVGFFKEFGGLQQAGIITEAFGTVNPRTKQFNTITKNPSNTGSPEERRLEDDGITGSVLQNQSILPGRVGQERVKIASVNNGWEYDLEDQYNAQQEAKRRRNHRQRFAHGEVRRTNI